MGKKRIDPFVYPKSEKESYLPINCTVLFFDVVGFTKETTNQEMKDKIRTIHDMITNILYDDYDWNETKHSKHNDLILVPTGDGYAIGFHPNKFAFKDILELTKKIHTDLCIYRKLPIRMGIAKGNVIRFLDMNDRVNLFGYGINTAARVMDLALPGQILLHETFAKDATGGEKTTDITYIGEYKVKHTTLLIYNYAKAGEFGNIEPPPNPISPA